MSEQQEVLGNANSSLYFQLDNQGQMDFSQQDITQVIPKLSQNILKYGEAEIIGNSQDTLRDSRSLFRPSSSRKGQLAPLDGPSSLPTMQHQISIADILESMFTSKVYEQDGVIYKQKVLCEEIDRRELHLLESELEIKLSQRKAKKTGICSIREDLHNQLFDEIIRQSTINCPERGMLLLRVRDQIKMTMSAYKVLHQGSVVFGNRKQVQADEGVQAMEDELKALKTKRVHLENEQIELDNEFDQLCKSYQEINEIEDKNKEVQMAFMKQTNNNLEGILQNIITSQAQE